jgi:hypothetical protein
MAILGTIFLAMDLFLSGLSRRAQLRMESDVARRNARTALDLALLALRDVAATGKYVTATAAMACPSAPEAHAHWVGLWRVEEGVANFDRWLVASSADGASEFSLPKTFEGESLAILSDYGLPDRCPLLQISDGDRIWGHYAFWISDESAKVNLAPPETQIPTSAIAQEFGDHWWRAQNLPIPAEIAKIRDFTELLRCVPSLPPECFHDLTLFSGGVLQNTAGEFLIDLTTKLHRRQFADFEFLFPPRPDLPQPPPTFALLSSYLEGAVELRDGRFPIRVGDGPCRQLYPPRNDCSFPLADLPRSEFGLTLATAYDFYPVLCGCRLAISARATGDRLTLILRPQFALWNPLAVALPTHDYILEWRTTETEERIVLPPDRPSLVIRANPTAEALKIFIGDEKSGTLFQGVVRESWGPGESKVLGPAVPGEGGTGGALLGKFFSAGDGFWTLVLPIPNGVTAVAVERHNSSLAGARWNNMTLRLSDGITGRCLQEVADFVNEDETVAYEIPRDGQEHPLFSLTGTLQTGDGGPRWLADYNPRAPQIRRSAYEHFAPFGFLGTAATAFLRIFPSWRVKFSDGNGDVLAPNFFGDGAPSAVLFALPRDIFSIATLQHLQLFPYSYHPAYAVGNSWAPPLLPRNEVWVAIDPAVAIAKNSEYFRGEMRFDASHLANESLYDHYFVSGATFDFSDGPQFFTHCRPWIDFNPDLPCDRWAPTLRNGGVFNVNGAGEGAWKIFLRALPLDSVSGLYSLPRFPGQSPSDGPFQRICRLRDGELDRLAECIVEEVRAHGPFASLGQFVNRHLGDRDDPSTRCGLLQRAIERAGLRDFPAISSDDRRGRDWFDDDATGGDVNVGAPADLSQADLLQFFGNALTVRGDTFLIRAYGDGATDTSNAAAALLEALVQRFPDGSLHVLRFRWIYG